MRPLRPEGSTDSKAAIRPHNKHGAGSYFLEQRHCASMDCLTTRFCPSLHLIRPGNHCFSLRLFMCRISYLAVLLVLISCQSWVMSLWCMVCVWYLFDDIATDVDVMAVVIELLLCVVQSHCESWFAYCCSLSGQLVGRKVLAVDDVCISSVLSLWLQSCRAIDL